MTSPMPHAPDQLSRFLLPDAGVRGVVVSLDQAWRDLTAHADNPPAVAELLGEAAAAAALFTAHAKVEGRLSVQLRSASALRTLFAECTAAGTLRGIAQLDESQPAPTRDLAALGPDAVLAITIENPARGSQDPLRYQGLVGLDAGTLAEAFEGYFRQSEQLPTRLLLACDGRRAAGLMLQKLPGDPGDDDGWNRVGMLFDTLREPELLELSAADVVRRLFHEESPAWLGDKPLRFACSCSRDRVAAMLVSLGRGEADAAVEAGGGEAQVRCEFCGQQYRFDAAAIAELFHDAAREMPAAAGLQ